MLKAMKIERLFRPNDSEETKSEIRKLVEVGYPVARLTDYQIKTREVNYYVNGTITIDPCTKYKHKGFDALLELLEEKYPRSSVIYLPS